MDFSKLKIVLIISILWAIPIHAEDYGSINATVVRVYDGDTFYADIEGWPDIVGKEIGIRINGIDTPEIRTTNAYEKALGYKARHLVVTMLEKAESVELRNMERGKYFRILADVYADGESVGAMLIDAGLARPYFGGTKEGWGAAK